MDDTQFGILIAVVSSGFAGLVGIIKWSVTRLTTALDSNTAAHLASVKAMTEMSVKLDFVYNATGRVDSFIKEEISGVHGAASSEETTPVETPRKPTGRYHYPRPKTPSPPDKG